MKNIDKLNLNNLRSKILVVISGQMRSYKFANFYTLNILKKYDPTFIVTTWKNQPEHQDDDSRIKKFTNIDISLHDIEKIYKPIIIDIEENNLEITNKLLGEKNKFDMVFPYRLISTRFQFYKFNRIYYLLSKLKEDKGISFDKILFIRPDIALTSNINLQMVKNNMIYFEDTLGDWQKQRSDRMFYGEYNYVMSFLGNICSFAKKYWDVNYAKDINQLPFQENLIKLYVDTEQINTYPFCPSFTIMREYKKLNFIDNLNMQFNRYKRLIKRHVIKNKS